MFKFLFGKSKVPLKETQRETMSRAIAEVNGLLALMPERPKLGVNLDTGFIEIELPERMPDEALALPAPELESFAAQPSPAAPRKG